MVVSLLGVCIFGHFTMLRAIILCAWADQNKNYCVLGSLPMLTN